MYILNRLTITKIEAKVNLLRIQFKCNGKIRRFFNKNTFFAEYDTSIENVPEAFLVIPFLATVCPVAWACKADIYAEIIDEEFLSGLEEVKKTLQIFYPKVGFGGNIHAKIVTTPDVGVHTKSMILFSGGIDSLETYIRHRNENPILVCVHGADVDVNNDKAWDTVMASLTSVSDKGLKIVSIRSNLRSMLDESVLQIDYGIDSWWGEVMHGLALLGLCAPITHINKIAQLYIASSFTKNYPQPNGSHPNIDNNVKWTRTRAIHDGYELSRQEKLIVIADHIKNLNPDLIIRSCYESDKGNNCSHCEKCARTLVGLEMVGIDPNKHGYNVNANTFLEIKQKLENAEWADPSFPFFWGDLQRHARPDQDIPHSEAKELINWLATVDPKAFKSKQKNKSLFSKRLIIYVIYKYLPFTLYKFFRKVVEAFSP